MTTYNRFLFGLAAVSMIPIDLNATADRVLPSPPPMQQAGQLAFVQPSPDLAEGAKSSLAKRGFPWYDESKDDFRTLVPPKDYDWDWLPDWLKNRDSSSRDSAAPLAGVFTALMWTFFALLLAFVVALLIHYLRTYRPDSGGDKPGHDAKITVGQLDALPAAVRQYGDFLAEAQRCLDADDLQGAIVFFYSYQLLALDRAGRLLLAKGKTNRRYVREVQKAEPRLLDVFRRSVALFERAFFGKLPISSDAFRELWQKRDLFLAMMEGRSASP